MKIHLFSDDRSEDRLLNFIGTQIHDPSGSRLDEAPWYFCLSLLCSSLSVTVFHVKHLTLDLSL